MQVGNYIQPLWEEIESFKDGDIYNGAVEAATTLIGALVVLAVGFLGNIRFTTYLLLSLISF